MSARITDNETIDLAQKMRQKFLLPFEIDEILSEIKTISLSIPNNLRPQCETFIDSIHAVHATTTLPYQLAQSKANALHFQRFHMAEKIRNIPLVEDYLISEDERNHLALSSAKNTFNSFAKSDDGLNLLVLDLSSTLLDALQLPSTANAANELLYQAIVGLWSAFEIFVRDVMISLLNTHPIKAKQVLNNPNSKKFFELPKLTIDELSESDFNLTSSMGSLILGSRDFSDVRVIRAAFSAIVPDNQLIDVLNDDKLWWLNQTRHLIVHRRGVVDEKYKLSTDSDLEIGERVHVSPQDLKKHFLITIQSATAFIKGISASANSAPESEKSE